MIEKLYQFIHSNFLRKEYEIWRRLLNWLDDEFLIVKTNVSYLRPRECSFWLQFIVFLVNIQAKSGNT